MPVPKVRGRERTRRNDGGWRRKRSDAGEPRRKSVPKREKKKKKKDRLGHALWEGFPP